MSALGQTQTCALHQTMSALPPIATAKADSRKGSCLLYPQKRTYAVQQGMSAKGQKQTLQLFDLVFHYPPISAFRTMSTPLLRACLSYMDTDHSWNSWSRS